MAEKKEYIAIDIFRVFCSLAVVSLHLLPFADVNPEFLFWFNQVLARVAVPFFFITAGFFVARKINDAVSVHKQIIRLLRLYLIYTLLHMDLIVKEISCNDIDVFDIVTEKIFVGTYMHLWYLAGLTIAIALLYVTVNVLKLKEYMLIAIIVILYIMGTVGNAYVSQVMKLPGMESVLGSYYDIFRTTRNGVFMGFPFVTMGYLLNKYEMKVKGRSICFFVCMILLTVEVYVAKYMIGLEGASMYFSLPLVIYASFSWLLSIRVDTKYSRLGRMCRKGSFLLYALHMLVHIYYGPTVYYRVNSLGYYLIIVCSTTVVALAIIYLSKYRCFRWLKMLY